MRPPLVHRFGRPYLVAGTLYTAVVVGLVAGWEFRPDSTGLLLAAVVVTLPLGIAGVIDIYLVYGLLQTLGSALGMTATLADGSNAAWFTVSDAIAVVAVFGILAAGNVVLLHDVAGHWRTPPTARDEFHGNIASQAVAGACPRGRRAEGGDRDGRRSHR